ncbi:MAG: polysaccharide deacetylase family protein [Halanaerobiales bacterium]
MINRYHLILVALLIGIIGGMVRFNPVVPVFNNQSSPYYHGVRGHNNIALTFNVAWGSEYIPDLLTTLENNKVKATFFVTGNWVKKNRKLLQEIANSGHEIGNHGYSHRHPEQLNREELIALIRNNEELIKNITGKKTRLFAPPYGEVNEKIASTVDSIGYKTIMWSADTIDWQRPEPEIIIQRAVNKIEDGGIILMHPTEPTVRALPEIIAKLEDRGFNFVTVSRLLEAEE